MIWVWMFRIKPMKSVRVFKELLLEGLGLHVSSYKGSKRGASSAWLTEAIAGATFSWRIHRVRSYKYFGLSLDDPIIWLSAVVEAITLSWGFQSTSCRFYGSKWCLTERSLLSFYKVPVVSRILYVIPLRPPTPAKWESSETIYQVSLRDGLCVPRL